jgi:hypothetical protein
MFSTSHAIERKERDIQEQERQLAQQKAELAKKKKERGKLAELEAQLEAERHRIELLTLENTLKDEQIREYVQVFRSCLGDVDHSLEDWQHALTGKWVAPSKSTLITKLTELNKKFGELAVASQPILQHIVANTTTMTEEDIKDEVEAQVQERLSFLNAEGNKRRRKTPAKRDADHCGCRAMGARCINNHCPCKKAGRQCNNKCKCGTQYCAQHLANSYTPSEAPTIPQWNRPPSHASDRDWAPYDPDDYH